MASVADPSSKNVYGDPLRPVPIVFVPGTMGTRLATEKDGVLMWNPCGAAPRSAAGDRSPGWLAPLPEEFLESGDGALLADLNLQLKPIGLFGEGGDIPGGIDRYPPALLSRAFEIKHFFSAIPEYYDSILFNLSNDPSRDEDLTKDLAPLGYVPKVFVAGYDWRVSCALAATKFVDKVVDEALAACRGAQKVILVAHSMGGVVSRYYCKAVGGDKVHALFLLGSPLLGAMKAYSWTKKGFAADDGEMLMLRGLLGNATNWSNVRFNRSLPSIYEMLYSPVYTNNIDPNWLQFDLADNQTGYPYSTVMPPIGSTDPTPGRWIDPSTGRPNRQFNNASEGFELAVDPFAGVGDDLETRDKSAKLLRDAEIFINSLVVGGKAFIPKNTFIVASTGVPTKTMGRLSRYGDFEFRDTEVFYRATWHVPGTDIPLQFEIPLEVEQPATGDETVPGASANPPAGLLSDVAISKTVTGVKHGNIPSHPWVQDWVRAQICTLVKALPQ